MPAQRLHFYDNKETVDRLMSKEDGLFHIIDEASRRTQDARYICERIKERKRGVHVKPTGSHEFAVAHYAGRLTYDASEIATRNRDFLPPEMIGAMRLSSRDAVKEMFTNKLTRSGSLTIVPEQGLAAKKTSKRKWNAIVQESSVIRVSGTAERVS